MLFSEEKSAEFGKDSLLSVRKGDTGGYSRAWQGSSSNQ